MAPGNPITQTRNPGAIAPALAKVGAQQVVAEGPPAKAKNTKPGGLKKKAAKVVSAPRNNPRGGMGVGNGMSY
jgi:hypothetical protein